MTSSPDVPGPGRLDAHALDRCLAAAYGPATWILDSVRQLSLPAAGQATRIRLRGGEPGSATSPVVPSHSVGRYEVHDEIARGGLGVVMRAHDIDLGREVALKVLLDRHAGDAGMVRRLIEEARIGGQLQHPGIVPVYEVGLSDDLKPFFTMKLVHGRTFAALLAERATPADDRTRYLGVFEQVCHAVAFANAHGVVHRDLKPGNVMVGAFGEVQVVDWGLAKVLDADDRNPESPRSAAAHASGPSSGLGGTPSYMAPEQARGEASLVDERVDVFGLGAMLCEILIGRPPYAAESSAAALAQARVAALGPVHEALAVAPIEPALRELCLDCLAVDLQLRPRHAGEVARRIADHRSAVEIRVREAQLLAEQARTHAAEQLHRAVAAEAAVEREQHRRQRTRLAVGAVLFVFAVAVGGWTWGTAARRERLAKTHHAVDLALQRAHQCWGQARSSGDTDMGRWHAAVMAVAEAETLAATWGVDADLHGRVRELSARVGDEAEIARAAAARRTRERQLAGRLRSIRDQSVDTWATDARRHVVAYYEVFGDVGIRGHEREEDAAAVVRDSGIAPELIDALDECVRILRAKWPQGWLTREWQRLARIAALADSDPQRRQVRQAWIAKDEDELLRTAAVADLDQWSATSLGMLGSCLADLGNHQAAADFLDLVRQRHPGDFWIAHDLAWAMRGRAHVHQRLRYMTVLTGLQPDSYHAWQDHGQALAAAGEFRAAVTSFERALAIRSDIAPGWVHLGETWLSMHEPRRAKAAFTVATRLQPDSAVAWRGLARSCLHDHDLDRGVAAAQEALCLDPSLALAHATLGALLAARGDAAAGVASAHQAVSLAPSDAGSWYMLGVLLEQARDRDGSRLALTRALTLDPELEAAHVAIGVVQRAEGHVDAAIASFRKALDLAPTDADAWFQLGNALRETGDLVAARDACRRTVAMAPDHGDAHGLLGELLLREGDLVGAELELRAALDRRRDAAALANLGTVLRLSSRFDEAANVLEEALQLTPDSWSALLNLGITRSRQGRVGDARGFLMQAAASKPDVALLQAELGRVHLRLGDGGAAAPCLLEALRLDPERQSAFADLAILEFQRGNLEVALPHCRRAVELDPADVASRTNLGSILFHLGRFDEAIPVAREATRLDAQWPSAWFLLGAASESLRQYREAVEAYGRAAGLGHPGAVGPLQDCERMLAMERRLPAAIAGTDHAEDADEALAFARLCAARRDFTNALRFFERAIAGPDALAVTLQTHACFEAAIVAITFAAGLSSPADTEQRAQLHRRAVAWLWQELRDCESLLEDGTDEQRGLIAVFLRSWRRHPGLAVVRQPGGSAELNAAEMDAMGALWQEWEAMLAALGG